MKVLVLTSLLTVITMTGCTSAAHHRADVQDDSADRVTAGVVQREVHIGMSGAAVIETIGSPNIVSTDGDRNEVWVYDKLATDISYSDSRSGVLGLIFGPVAGGGGGGIGVGTQGSGAKSTSQRTLTVVIKFDSDQRVRDFAYHASRF